MKFNFMVTSATLIMMDGAAFAQISTYSQSTTTTSTPEMAAPAPVVPPEPGMLSTTQTIKAKDSTGNSYEAMKTTYGNVNGAASDSTTTTTTAPPPVTYYSQ